MRIDLHGLREQEAYGRIVTKLMDFEMSHYETLEIITGNGQVLKGLAIDTVEEQGFRWSHSGGNTGSIVVKK